MLRRGEPGMCPVKVSRVLERGERYVVFLAHVKGIKYALSVEDVSRPADLQTFNWQHRLYATINKMPDEDSVFLTKTDCYLVTDRKHTMSLLIPVKDLDVEKELPKSRSTRSYGLILMEYTRRTTLAQFMEKRSKIPRKLIYSFALQIAKIILILAAKGYSHNNLQAHNIVINKTDSETFTLNGKEIKYHSYQLSAINYEMLLHKEHNSQQNRLLPSDFINNRKKWIFDELSAACSSLFIRQDRTIASCRDQRRPANLLSQIKRLPLEGRWDVYQRACKKMFRKEPHYCLEKIQGFLDVFPNAKSSYASIDGIDAEMSSSKLSKALTQLFTTTRPPPLFWEVISRVADLYVLDFPDGSYDFGWCCPAKALIPRDLLQELQTVKTTGAYVDAILER